MGVHVLIVSRHVLLYIKRVREREREREEDGKDSKQQTKSKADKLKGNLGKTFDPSVKFNAESKK